MIKKLIILLAAILFCMPPVAYAGENVISCNTLVNGRHIQINGQIPNATHSNMVTILVGSEDNILYIDQTDSSNSGEFYFSFQIPEGTEPGVYEYKIGSNAECSVYQGFINYGAKCKFAEIDMSININSYVPTLTGTITCGSGKNMHLTFINKTNEVTIADGTITFDDGEFAFSYQLPNLLQSNAYSININCSDGNQSLSLLNFEVDSSILLISASGSVELSDGISLDSHIQTIGNNLLDRQVTFTSDREFSANLPNLAMSGSYHVLAEFYEPQIQFTNGSISADLEVENEAVTASGQINLGQGQQITASITTPDGNVITSCNATSETDGIFTIPLLMPADSASGVYTLKLENAFLDEAFSTEFLYVKALEAEDIYYSKNRQLFTALKKARPGLDYDCDGIIKVVELSNITGSLDISNSNIESISGLQSCTGISTLYISNNNISNLAPIANLHKLTVLVADGNQISSITALPTGLSLLNVDDNQITDMPCVKFLRELTVLFANNNQLTDVSFLESKEALRYLTLKNNAITDISPLADSNILLHVDLSNNELTNVDVFHDNQYLKDLRLSHNQITSIAALPDVFYYNLYLDHNPLSTEEISSMNAINKVS